MDTVGCGQIGWIVAKLLRVWNTPLSLKFSGCSGFAKSEGNLSSVKWTGYVVYISGKTAIFVPPNI